MYGGAIGADAGWQVGEVEGWVGIFMRVGLGSQGGWVGGVLGRYGRRRSHRRLGGAAYLLVTVCDMIMPVLTTVRSGL
jgi:hypothetical protein